MEVGIKILNELGNIKKSIKGIDEAILVFSEEYKEGDKVVIESSEINTYLVVQVDDAIGSAFVYITEREAVYSIPFGEKRIVLSPKSFYGNTHVLSIRAARKEEIEVYKNLAINLMDNQTIKGVYPHASANVETRGEAVFAASNSINGNHENHSHGRWPYESWGIGMRDDAELKLEFGRNVIVDKIVLYTRADFPHDNWWTKVTFRFSDGSKLVSNLDKTDKAHVIEFPQKEIDWLTFGDLIKADDPSPFPALSQIEVYGVEKEI